jgi:protein-disulfide isomerase
MSVINRRLILAALSVVALAACSKGGGSSGAGDMTLGDPNAKVSMIEYASASCTHCARFNNDVFPEFKNKYIDTGKVHYTFREFLTPPVQVAAAGFLLARCAGNDKYFPVLDAVFRGQDEMFANGDTSNVRPVMLRIARSVGMSEGQFTACITNEKALKALNDRVQTYMDKDGIDSTPTFVINGKKWKSGEVSMVELDGALQPLLK